MSAGLMPSALRGSEVSEIFRTKHVGYIGKKKASRQYMQEIEDRARRMKRACRPKVKTKQLNLWGET